MADAQRPTLEVEERAERGSRATRRLRRDGLVPGVRLRRQPTDDAVSFKVGRARPAPACSSTAPALFDVKIGGGEVRAGDRQGPAATTRCATRSCTSTCSRSASTRRSRRTVGVELEGAEEAPGVKEGGVLEHVTRELNIEALPTDIPEQIVVDVSGMEIAAHAAPLRDHRSRGRRVPRRPRGDHHRHGRRPDRGRGARDRGGDRAGRRGRRADRGRRGRGGRRAPRAPSGDDSGRRGDSGARSSRVEPRSAAAARRRQGRLADRRAGQPRRPLRPHPPQRRLRGGRAGRRALGAAEGQEEATPASTPTAAPARAARAWACCCRRPS